MAYFVYRGSYETLNQATGRYAVVKNDSSETIDSNWKSTWSKDEWDSESYITEL